MLKVKTKTKIARDFVNNFPTNVLKSITFRHPMGVCGWTFHCTEVDIFNYFKLYTVPAFSVAIPVNCKLRQQFENA